MTLTKHIKLKQAQALKAHVASHHPSITGSHAHWILVKLHDAAHHAHGAVTITLPKDSSL